MKKQILKIAGVKSEKEFYKKFPTEEAFMAKHGKAFKKAQIGTYITSEAPSTIYQPADIRGMYDELDYQLTGMTSADRAKMEAIQQAAAQLAQSGGDDSGSGGGMDMGQMAQFAEAAIAKKGEKIPKAQGGIGYPTGPQLTPSTQNLQQQQFNWGTDYNIPQMPAPTTKKKPNLAKGIPVLGQVIGGIQNIKAQKEAYRAAKQQTALTDVMGDAAASRPVQQPRRQYVRPEDMAFQPEQMFPSYGVGTNVLAEFGASVGGGEIMNTYAPDTLYDNLGYEPLNDSERYKQFYHGGKMHKAAGGFMTALNSSQFGQTLGSPQAQQLANIVGGGQTGGYSEVLGGIGGLFGGPIGTAATFIGSAVDKLQQDKIENQQDLFGQNITKIVGQNFGTGVQQQFGASMEDGGMTSPYAWVSHTWQPQKIVSFGGHNVKDLLRPPHDADMLRAGGHLKEYTPPSAAAMSTERPAMQTGGELQTHWGGYAEPMSYNPFLPDGGETIMFRGQSHDESDGRGNTGIGITYGENPVEVERGEPAVKLKDGTSGDSSLVVFGNLKIPKSYLPFLGKEAEGKKFKTYVADLSKKENKQNKKLDKATRMLEDFEVSTPIDKITLNSLQYTMLGANQKLKELADKKITAASLQNAINDTAQEMGLVADDLARGRVKVDKEAMEGNAEFGKMIKAQDGTKKLSKLEARADVPKQTKTGKYYGDVTDKDVQRMIKNNPWYDWSNFDPESEADIEDFQIAFNKKAEEQGVPIRLNEDGYLGKQTVSAKGVYSTDKTAPTTATSVKDEPVPLLPSMETYVPPTGLRKLFEVTPNYKRSQVLDAIGAALPYIVRPDQEELDPRQLIGEMYALATNQLEPVQAQTMQPQLSTPYDISLQDILNENEATFRSQQRMLGYNPAAQSMLNAQKYQANQKVLGEQFRLNQAEKQRVYEQNRNLLNQFGLQNLAILDRQYERQEKAKSITKGTNIEALKSIGDKFMRNQLENRTLATAQNLYGFRFDPRFRAFNVNAPFQPQIPTVYTRDQDLTPVDRMGTPIPPVSQNTAPINRQVPIAPPQPTSQTTLPSYMEDLFPDMENRMLTPDEIKEMYRTSGKDGKKVSKKKGINSSVVKAFKNL